MLVVRLKIKSFSSQVHGKCCLPKSNVGCSEELEQSYQYEKWATYTSLLSPQPVLLHIQTY